MLKRYQIMLPDWLHKDMEKTAMKKNISISEVIRLHICENIFFGGKLDAPKKKIKEYSDKLQFRTRKLISR